MQVLQQQQQQKQQVLLLLLLLLLLRVDLIPVLLQGTIGLPLLLWEMPQAMQIPAAAAAAAAASAALPTSPSAAAAAARCSLFGRQQQGGP